jgi:hypothetical protein
MPAAPTTFPRHSGPASSPPGPAHVLLAPPPLGDPAWCPPDFPAAPCGPGMPSAGAAARALGAPGGAVAGRGGAERLGLGWASARAGAAAAGLRGRCGLRRAGLRDRRIADPGRRGREGVWGQEGRRVALWGFRQGLRGRTPTRRDPCGKCQPAGPGDSEPLPRCGAAVFSCPCDPRWARSALCALLWIGRETRSEWTSEFGGSPWSPVRSEDVYLAGTWTGMCRLLAFRDWCLVA